MINFKDRIKPDMQSYLHTAVPNFYDEYLKCMSDDIHAGDLRHCSLYLVCPENYVDKKQINENPVGIVANNTEEASEVYAAEYNKAAYIVIELESRCDNIKVEMM